MAKVTDIIKYEGNNDVLVYKSECEDFNSWTQLIVHESQEALFFSDGRALDLFREGRYTLSTQNIPILSKLFNRLTDGTSPFHCEVYFVNKAEQMAIKWGTESKIQFMEPTYQFPLSIGLCGVMSLKAVDSRKIILNLVGTETILTREKLTEYFRAFIQPRVKSHIGQTIRTEKISIFEIDEHIDKLSEGLKARIAPDFEAYGFALESFTITRVLLPDGDEQYEKFKSLHFKQYADIAEARLNQEKELINAQTEAQKVVIASQATATKRMQEGYTYQQERGFDVSSEIARNPATAQMSNIGIGLGMMSGVAPVFGGMIGATLSNTVNSIGQSVNSSMVNANPTVNETGNETAREHDAQPVPTSEQQMQPLFCENCGKQLMADALFCDECGTAVPREEKKCSNCGYEFERPGKFCPKCGSKRNLG